MPSRFSCKPDLACAVYVMILMPNAFNLRLQRSIPFAPAAVTGDGSPRSGFLLVVRRWGNRQHRTDRLDPKTVLVSIDIARLYFSRRSSSAWAKKRRCRLQNLIRTLSARDSPFPTPSAAPVHRWLNPAVSLRYPPHDEPTCVTFSVVQPIFEAIDAIADHRDSYSD